MNWYDELYLWMFKKCALSDSFAYLGKKNPVRYLTTRKTCFRDSLDFFTV